MARQWILPFRKATSSAFKILLLLLILQDIKDGPKQNNLVEQYSVIHSAPQKQPEQ